MLSRRLPLSKAFFTLSAFALLLAGSDAFAQVVYDAQVPFSDSSVTFSNPDGVAVAPDGTIYVTDIEVGSNALYRITPTTGTVSGGTASIASTITKLTPTGVTMEQPTAVAVTSTGALYVADATAGIVFEIASPESGATPAATPITYPGTEKPTALAADSSNNLYIADETQGAIYEVTGGVATQLSIGTGLKPVGLIPDSSGDVYFADEASNEIYEYSATTKSASPFLSTFLLSGTSTSFSFGNTLVGMGIDPAGNIYVLDGANLVEATSGTNAFTVPTIGISPGSFSVASNGNIFVTDDTGKAVDEIFYNHNPVNVGSLHAGTGSPEIQLNFNFVSAEANVAYGQSVQGDNTGEFSNPGVSNTTYPCGTSAIHTSVAAGTSCNFYAEVTYQSTTPGFRLGADGLTGGTSDVLEVPIVGTSVAGGLFLFPATQTSTSQSSQTLYEPQGLAITGNGGYLIVADEGGVGSGSSATNHPAIWAYANGTGTPTSVGTGTGFAYPTALALDGAGNLYVADYNGAVYKISPASKWSGAGTKLAQLNGMLNHPMSLAVDPSGNLYIGDMGSAGVNANASSPGYIIEVPGNGGLPVKLNYPVIFPNGLTTDAYGNLYIADGGDGITNLGSVDIVTASTGAISSINFATNGYDLDEPTGLSFDGAGDLYVLDGFNDRVLVAPVTYTGSSPTVTAGNISELGFTPQNDFSGLVTPSSLVVWPNGENISIADIGYFPTGGTSSPTQLLRLSGVSTSVNTTTGLPLIFGVNTGNQGITFAAPGGLGSNFSVTSCGNTNSTVTPQIENTCFPTVGFSGSASTTQTATITLNGNTADDYAVLGNVINATAQPTIPTATVTGSGLETNPSGGYQVVVTIENTGGGTLTIPNVQLTDATGATLASPDPCLGASLTANSSCSVTVDLSTIVIYGYNHGNVVFTDNSGGVADPPGATQTECAYVDDVVITGVFGGSGSGACGGRLNPTVVSNGPITSPSSTQNKVGTTFGAFDTPSGTGSSEFRSGSSNAASQSENAPEQNNAQPVSTTQTGATPQQQQYFGFAPSAVPSFNTPDSGSQASDNSTNSTSDNSSTTSDDQDSSGKDKKDSTKKTTDAGSNGSADAAPQQ
ncbi:MAG TPA: NHL repeat-containing protein [Acidobacteriaceae bacterium]|nr:NHL repeat-containing protein [Acidobacteriaceae bacterium]